MADLVTLGDTAVKYALENGADECESYLELTTALTFNLGAPELDLRHFASNGVGVRVVKNNAIGFSSVSSLQQIHLRNAVDRALDISRLKEPDPAWESLPDAKPPSIVRGIYDESISALEPIEIVRLAKELISSAVNRNKATKIALEEGVMKAITGTFAIVNSNGIAVQETSTLFYTWCCIGAQRGIEHARSSFYTMSRAGVPDIANVGRLAAEKAVKLLGAKRIETGIFPAIIESIPLSQLVHRGIVPSTFASSVSRKRSLYTGLLGSEVTDESISITDDGLAPGGLGTHAVDAEGVPRQKTTIIEKGILKGFLYDNYYAKMEKKESTGNAARRSSRSQPFEIQPTPYVSNLVIEPCRGPKTELFEDMKNGMIISAIHGTTFIDQASANFAVGVSEAFKVQNGAIAYPTHGFQMVGNVSELFRHKVTRVGSEKVLVNEYQLPPIQFSELKFVGDLQPSAG